MDVLQDPSVVSPPWFPDEPYTKLAEEMNHIELLHSNGWHYDCIVNLYGEMSCAEHS